MTHEAMLKELLDIEEKNDIFNLTREERREFQNWVKKQLEKEESVSAEGEYIKKEEFKSAIHNFFYGLKHNVTEEDIQAYADALALYSFPDREKGEQLYSDLLRVKHGTMNIDSLIDKVYADMRKGDE